MKDQHRFVKVLGALIVSMTIGAFVLLALDEQPLTDGPFSLKELSVLTPAKKDVASHVDTTKWDGVEVYYNNSSDCNLENLVSGSNSQLHFVIGDPASGNEGVIKPTGRWKKQKPCSFDLQEGQNIIRICIFNDNGNPQPTNLQFSRTTELVEVLSRIHKISPARIRYPVNWQI